MKFAVVVYRSDLNGYSAEAPDFPGYTETEDTLEAAVEALRKRIQQAVDWDRENGRDFSEPRSTWAGMVEVDS